MKEEFFIFTWLTSNHCNSCYLRLIGRDQIFSVIPILSNMNAIRILLLFAAFSLFFKPVSGQKGIFKAIETGDMQKVSTYISGGSDLNQTFEIKKNKTGSITFDTLTISLTPLEYSVFLNNTDAVKLIAGKMDKKKAGYQTVLNNSFGLSVWVENFEMSMFLLNEGADINSVCTICFGQSPVQTALALSDFRLFYELKKRGAQLDVKGIKNQTLLHSAASTGNETIVSELLAASVEIDAQDDDGLTPLLCAASKGHYGIFRLLEAKGANIKITDYTGRDAMIYALICKNDSLTGYLISKGMANTGIDEYQRTSLLYACVNNDFKTAKLLLEAGAYIPDYECYTGDLSKSDYGSVLTIPIYNRNTELAKLILEHMPEYIPGEYAYADDPDRLKRLSKKYIKDKSLLNYLEYGPMVSAVLEGNDTLIKVLISRGFDINRADGSKWWTPIMYACKNNDLRMVRFLTEREADLHYNYESDESPLTLAIATGNVELVRFIHETDNELIYEYEPVVLKEKLEKYISDKAFVKYLYELRIRVKE